MEFVMSTSYTSGFVEWLHCQIKRLAECILIFSDEWSSTMWGFPSKAPAKWCPMICCQDDAQLVLLGFMMDISMCIYIYIYYIVYLIVGWCINQQTFHWWAIATYPCGTQNIAQVYEAPGMTLLGHALDCVPRQPLKDHLAIPGITGW